MATEVETKEWFQKVRSKSANVFANIDVPSAVLGASMPGMAVLVAVAVSSKRWMLQKDIDQMVVFKRIQSTLNVPMTHLRQA
jgi:hypothetical protein